MIHQWSVRAKLGAAFSVLIAILLVVSTLSLMALGTARESFSEFVDQTLARAAVAGDVQRKVQDRAIAARNLILVSAADDRAREHAAVVAAHEAMTRELARLRALADEHDDKEERSLVAAMVAVEARYGPLAMDIVALALAGQREEALRKLNAECRPLLAELLAATATYIAHLEEESKSQVQTAESAYNSSRRTLLLACALSVVAAVVLAMAITRGLMRALGSEPSTLREAARRVAQGDLAPLSGAAEAPPGSVLSSLGDMQASLSRVVSQVRVASELIAASSLEIANGSADLSRRTEDQAASLEQTAASMEQMNATVQSNAQSAQHASRIAGSASTTAADGGELMNRMVSTIGEISSSSRRISDIISVIDGIAFQTNILALNAAVEAARAGAQGRGFAVVAGEVRGLAQRSAEAAREIKQLIGASVEKVEVGTRLAGEAGAAISNIVAEVRRVADLIGEISSATTEQAGGIGQVSSAVSHLDRATQQNAALVEESAAAAETLKQQASQLMQVMSVFRLDGSNASHQSPDGVNGWSLAPEALTVLPQPPGRLEHS